MRPNRYVYHYFAQYQISAGTIVHQDGILLLENRIRCYDDYKEIKKQIDPEHFSILAITSLSFIGMERYFAQQNPLDGETVVGISL